MFPGQSNPMSHHILAVEFSTFSDALTIFSTTQALYKHAHILKKIHTPSTPHNITMKSFNIFCVSVFVFVSTFLVYSTNAATFNIRNNCPYTVWAAAVPGGGRRLDRGQTWTINVNAGTTGGRVWARTGCNFDGNGRGSCQTGDCGGVLACTGYGRPPNTLAEFALNQFQNLDFFDISLVDGFNVPMDFSPTTGSCRGIRCTADINGQCPSQLRTTGGCNNPCTVFQTDQYCCNSGNCGPTDFSRFFKQRCPDAYSYPKDDQTSTFTCPGGTNYNVVFCP
ncbi:OLC1v1029609C1 [Oldenlandia corymbosa var. corymbosa]|uniref:OLC1v1029609C1 n=1 Tax=Oldenlandia corymbosa var. corymbosa TaxID=529605 RepID=A0AAV1CF61_OLDCO|nr:OLC1v1029609C1 [Oldenlandia corymbosa var. corymbosa]